MNAARFSALSALVVAVSVHAGAARAENGQDKAAANVLFEDGKRLLEDGKTSEACGKFAESNRLDLGIGTTLWLADCYERNGQSASAWAQFDEAADLAARKKDPREKIARGRASQLEATLVRLTVEVSPDAAVDGLEVRCDDSLVGRAMWGMAVPVDPGAHVISVRAPKKKSWELRVEITDSRATSVQVPVLIDEPSLLPVVQRMPEPSTGSPAGSTQRLMGLVLAGAGVVGVGMGTYFGLAAKGKLDDSNANNHCHDANRCDAAGLVLRSDAKSAATVSTVSLALGGAAIAGGVALYLTAPTGSALRVAPSVGRGGSGVLFAGSF